MNVPFATISPNTVERNDLVATNFGRGQLDCNIRAHDELTRMRRRMENRTGARHVPRV
jgi:hypothetical protein